MKIRFHGPIDEVTGSCYELVDDVMQVHLLVDFGLVQGEPNADKRNARPLPFDARALTHVVLTHAHADHSGLVPRLYAEGFDGTVYCTDETAELARLVQRDAAGHGQVPYTTWDVEAQRFHEPGSAATFGVCCPIGTDLFLQFYRSGHMLGATSVTVRWGPREAQRSITFSGDLGPNVEDAEVLSLIGYRMSPARADYVVMESTYGAIVRAPLSAEDRIRALGAAVERGVRERRGTVIIPCFALERLPDVLCDLTVLFAREPERFTGIPVSVDTRMGLEANKIMMKGLARTTISKDGTRVRDTWLGRGIFRLLGLDPRDADARASVFDALDEMLLADHAPRMPREGALESWRRIWTPSSKQNAHRERLGGPAIVLATGGMCDGGPVQDYLMRLLPDPTTTVLFPGYCSRSTVGGQLLELRDLDASARQRLGGELTMKKGSMRRAEVRAAIEKLDGYSAHADQAGLVEWLWSARPGEPRRPIGARVFISHGSPESRRCLAAAIRARAAAEAHVVNVELPPRDRWFDLDHDVWLEEGLTREDLLRLEIQRLRSELASERGNLGDG